MTILAALFLVGFILSKEKRIAGVIVGNFFFYYLLELFGITIEGVYYYLIAGVVELICVAACLALSARFFITFCFFGSAALNLIAFIEFYTMASAFYVVYSPAMMVCCFILAFGLYSGSDNGFIRKLCCHIGRYIPLRDYFCRILSRGVL